MNILALLIAASLLLATGFLFGFIWAVRSGQYEDTATPAMRMLLDDMGRGSSARLDVCAVPPHPNPLPRGEGVAYSAPQELDHLEPFIATPDGGSVTQHCHTSARS